MQVAATSVQCQQFCLFKSDQSPISLTRCIFTYVDAASYFLSKFLTVTVLFCFLLKRYNYVENIERNLQKHLLQLRYRTCGRHGSAGGRDNFFKYVFHLQVHIGIYLILVFENTRYAILNQLYE